MVEGRACCDNPQRVSRDCLCGSSFPVLAKKAAPAQGPTSIGLHYSRSRDATLLDTWFRVYARSEFQGEQIPNSIAMHENWDGR
jgi:hypothetical protein